MNYSKVLVVGLKSSIAALVMPELDFDKEILFGISRDSKTHNLPWIRSDHILISDFPFADEVNQRVLEEISPLGSEKILVINFAGIFGVPATLDDLNIQEIIEVLNSNVVQFLSIFNLLKKCPPGSFLIGFSGGGVGGDNMDASSLGYLMSKFSLAGVSEILDKDLKGKRSGVALIAPGPFPSNMQTAVANAPEGVVPENARKQAAGVKADATKITRLVNTIRWVANNPNESGGRTWSAQRDDFSDIERSERFGKMRRIIE